MASKQLTTAQKIAINNKRRFVYIALTAFVTPLAVLIVFFLIQQIQTNRSVIGAQQESINLLESNIESVTEVSQQFIAFERSAPLIPNQEKTNSSTVLSALPTRYDLPALSVTIENLAKKSGVSLRSFSGTDESSSAVERSVNPTPQEILFDISVAGSYPAVVAFMNNLENSIRPYIVSNASINGTGSEIQLRLSLKTYYQPAYDAKLTTKKAN